MVFEKDMKMKPIKGQMLNNMLLLVTSKFNNVFDRGGQPYVLHCLKVMYYVKSDDEEIQCIALGHDLVEDCDVTYQSLQDAGFTPRIIEGIRAMTKVPGETDEEYLAKIKANPDAIRVKLADLRHNSDIRRLKGVSEKDIKRIAKYHSMYLELKELI
jgi:(p)ppGpp synthase/HD superfamily hydrolase